MTIFNYTVNYIDLIIVGIMILFAIIGSYRGIFLTIVNFIRFVLGMFLCVFTSTTYSKPIYDTFLKEKIISWVNDKIIVSNNLEDISSKMNDALSSMPEFVLNSMNLKPSALDKVLDTDKLAVSITNTYLEPIAIGIIKVALFLAVFILFFALTGLVISLIRKHNKKKREENNKHTLKDIDRIIGCVFGLLKGAVVVFAFVSIVNDVICNFDYASSQFLTTANNSILFNEIVNFNPFNFITEGIIWVSLMKM